MGIIGPYKVSKNILNIKNFKANMKSLFAEIKGLLEELNYDVDDTAYKYQGKPGEIDEVWINLSADKNIDHYSKFIIEVQVIVENAKETTEKGKKVISGQGKIIFVSKILLDYDDKWRKDPILHFLQKIYEKYIYVGTRKNHETKIAFEMFNLRDELKKLMEMK